MARARPSPPGPVPEVHTARLRPQAVATGGSRRDPETREARTSPEVAQGLEARLANLGAGQGPREASGPQGRQCSPGQRPLRAPSSRGRPQPFCDRPPSRACSLGRGWKDVPAGRRYVHSRRLPGFSVRATTKNVPQAARPWV